MIEHSSRGGPNNPERAGFHPFKKITEGITRRIVPPISPELSSVVEQVKSGEHPLFGPKTEGLIIEEYGKSPKKSSHKGFDFVRFRSFGTSDGKQDFETSYVSRKQPDGTYTIEPEGIFPIDPNEKR